MHMPAFCSPAPPPARTLRRAAAVSPRRPAPRFARADAQSSPTQLADSAAPPPSPPETRDLLKCLVCGSSLPDAPYPAIDTLPSDCPTCDAPLPRRAGYVDLTALRARGPRFALPVANPFKQALFQLPNVSFAYERGWRDGFKRAGFPGPDAEADLALDFLLPAATLLDMSCGSGLLARRLANLTSAAETGPRTRVVAADYSDAMLAEAAARARNDARVPRIDFVRADVAHLPFADAAFDAVHAGAALHCWPRLQDGLRELARVLVPGGGLFATTFAKGAYFSRAAETLLVAAEDAGLYEPPYRFFTEDELTFLFQAAGFVDVCVRREGSACLIVQARNAL